MIRMAEPDQRIDSGYFNISKETLKPGTPVAAKQIVIWNGKTKAMGVEKFSESKYPLCGLLVGSLFGRGTWDAESGSSCGIITHGYVILQVKGADTVGQLLYVDKVTNEIVTYETPYRLGVVLSHPDPQDYIKVMLEIRNEKT